ncbi:5' exonuclease Apollo [Frankliniella fusca]|uniref:5' exonuclease Apollo n=1 Tax=Frankliniella fusca TaxID=407009 RepID=A0AAE1LUI4_9NEOP|nr:5' exonuclease Apollo [Frankliniella fusca]
MSGHSIDSEDFVIVVDKWDASFLRRPGCKPHYFFLTHLHADHIKGLTSTWSRMIYTSPFNAWLLPMRRNVKPMLLKEVELNVTHTIRKSNNDIAFQFTLLDANHCPGAVMFLFQGSFGNLLYTGDFRYSPRILEYPVLSQIIRNKELSTLYLDNTYAAATCKFPSREEALKEVLKIVDENPDCKILIGMRQLGKEEVLRAVALHVNEKVCVSTQRLQILSKLEYEDVFTTDASQSRIHAVELHTITQRHSQESSKVVSIKLTSMYECGNTEKQRGNIYIVPYSDHSSHTEIMEFVNHLRPLKLYPIVLPKIPKMTADTGPWYRMSTINCVIPEEILQLCGPSADPDTPSTISSPVSENGPLLTIKFHPASKSVNFDKKSSSVTYIDEGMNVVPFDSLESHLTNNNKARKHIKASWTRLAPKILSQKGIKFNDPSPEKSSDLSEATIPKVSELVAQSAETSGRKTKEDNNFPVPSIPNASNAHDDLLLDVPLSDDELDMPSSASELAGRMQLSCNRPSINGIVSEDRKSECSSELTVASMQTECVEDSVAGMRRTRSKEKLESLRISASKSASPKDSDSDVSSSMRTTRSKSSLNSVKLVSRPRTRLSLESQIDLRGERASPNRLKPTRRSLKSPSLAVSHITRSRSTPQTNGLSKRAFSLENLSSTSKESSNNTSRRITRGSREDLSRSLSNILSSRKTVVKGKRKAKVVVVDLEDSEKESTSNKPDPVTNLDKRDLVLSKEILSAKDISPASEFNSAVEIEKSESDKSKQTYKAEESNVTTDLKQDPRGGKESSAESSSQDVISQTESSGGVNKKIPNGNLANFNGIHINSPGRKRVPLSCDWNAAQEIAKKETEQALKALETLNQMKGFKTRNIGNRTGIVALRRLSADNVPSKSPVKSQNLVVMPVSPTGLRRRRTASILSSMASTFSKSPSKNTPSSSTSVSIVKESTNQQEVVSAPEALKEISPILPIVENKRVSPRRGNHEQPSSSSNKRDAATSPITKDAATSPILRAVTGRPGVASVRKGQKEENMGQFPAGVENRKLDFMSELSTSESQLEERKEVGLPETSSLDSDHVNASEVKTEEVVARTISKTDEKSDKHNLGLFLTEETLAPSTSSKTVLKTARKSFHRRQNDLNVDLIRLKVGFAMTRKGPKRLSLPSRLSTIGRESPKLRSDGTPLQSREKVQDWKKKISLRLRKSPQRRYKYKSPNKLRENAKRTLATILKKNSRNPSGSQVYEGDVEDCTEVSQKSAKEVNEVSSGYIADIECLTPTDGGNTVTSLQISQISQESSVSKSVISDSQKSEEAKMGLQSEVRRSSRLLKEDSSNRSQSSNISKSKSDLDSNPTGKSIEKSIKPLSTSKVDHFCEPETSNKDLSPSSKCSNIPAISSSSLPSPGSFSERISEKSRLILNKSTDNVLAQKSPNLLSLMADAFKKSVSPTPSTANILSSMAENFKKLDESSQVSPSLSIQLISSKLRRPTPKEKNPSDWDVQITRVDSSSNKSQPNSPHPSFEGLPIPKSLSIEIIPESDATEPVRRKGPSPPTITICPEVIDLSSDCPDSSSQSSINSLPIPPGPRRLVQGATRWPQRVKPERDIVLSPPQSIWKRGSAKQGSDNVIIDIQTQEDPQKVPHCPVHCTCGAASRQGTCMGTMRNLIEEDADCLYEVPLSPEDFEDSGAMLALGKGWIESCFGDADDRDEFFQSYDEILQTVDDIKLKKSKPISSHSKKQNIPPQSNVRRVFSSTKSSAPSSVQQTTVSNVSRASLTATKISAPAIKKQVSSVSKPITLPNSSQPKMSRKRPSTDSEASTSLKKETVKKRKLQTDEQSKRYSGGQSIPSRRSSSSSTSSGSKSRNSKRSLSPILPPPPPPPPKKLLETDKEKKEKAFKDQKEKEDKKLVEVKKDKITEKPRGKRGNASGSSSESPENRRPRLKEHEKLTDTGKHGANKRYRSSVKRSLDHLMTRQKLRSDKRVKTSSSSRS